MGESGGVEQGEVAELKAQLEKKKQALTQAQLDQDTLTAELEELDRQNQEATQVCHVTNSNICIFHLALKYFACLYQKISCVC